MWILGCAAVCLAGSVPVNDPDYNTDATVDLADFARLAEAWGTASADWNLVGDDLIDLEDLLVFSGQWMRTIPCPPGYRLVWSDEFYGPEVNSSNWTFETGTGRWGWGNNEWQYYTSRPENVRIENGMLVIEARKESYGGRDYTSARMKTQGKRSFRYGRIEARIRMPVGGDGIWPAFWMMGSNYPTAGWPACGEIDIVEMMEIPNRAMGTIHYGAPGDHHSSGGANNLPTHLSQNFHVYAIEWTPTWIRWYRDEVNYYTTFIWWSSTGPFPAPFDQEFFILLNFAVGANWMDENPAVPFPQRMLVDYVRVYQPLEPY